jgi:NADPH-dependent 2,4-dienoyl-CoA reductase/sulfur reductase-like enzyme
MSGRPFPPDGRVVIVGASLAGARAAETLRSSGFNGRVTIVGDESHAPYDRPPLSKQLLSGAWARERIDLPTEQLSDVELLLGRTATHLDLTTRDVSLHDGTQLSYDGLIVATGSRARTLDHLLTAPSERVLTLRTVDDTRKLNARLRGHVAIVGAGFIGSEVASTAIELGAKVTVIEPQAGPMRRILGTSTSAWLATAMRRAGVDLRLGVAVVALSVTPGDTAVEIALSDGDTVVADTVVVGVGAVPNVEWLAGSGVELNDGLVCDEALFAADQVVAAGDIARWYRADLGRTVRLEHWTNAVKQAERAAHNLLVGSAAALPFVEQPYVWSDQFGIRIEVVGLPSEHHEDAIVWGSPEDNRFLTSYRDGGELTAIVGVNATRPLLTLRRRLAKQPELNDELLSLVLR